MIQHVAAELAAVLGVPHNVRAMIEASDRGRPAVEAVDPLLTMRFPDLLDDTSKPQVGKVIKQVLQSNGYRLIPDSEVPCVGTLSFKNGSRYERAA